MIQDDLPLLFKQSVMKTPSAPSADTGDEVDHPPLILQWEVRNLFVSVAGKGISAQLLQGLAQLILELTSPGLAEDACQLV